MLNLSPVAGSACTASRSVFNSGARSRCSAIWYFACTGLDSSFKTGYRNPAYAGMRSAISLKTALADISKPKPIPNSVASWAVIIQSAFD